MMNDKEDVIKKVDGPCVVLAGAGTGKTYTIVEKIKYLIKEEIYNPEKIVCITFSNEAANNLMIKIRSILVEGQKEPIVRTFHAFSSDLLIKYGEKIGIKYFNILDPNEAKVILHKYLKINVGNCHKYIGAIGIAKDLGIELNSMKEYFVKKIDGKDLDDLQKNMESLDFKLKTLYLKRIERGRKKELYEEFNKISDILNLKKFIGAWTAYEKIKLMKNYLDYSDLNKNALKLLKENIEIAFEFDYIIVDEFQDTNKIQLDFLFSLIREGRITIVGDMNQSIYRFRGAYNKNFNEFKERLKISSKDFFNLDKSFRSSNKILKLAHKLILNNYSDKNDKNCFEVRSFESREGENVDVYELKNGKEEARKVVELVKEELNKGTEINEICVMFRTHQQGRIIKKVLEFSGISFVSINKNSLFKEKSVKTVIDYLTIIQKLITSSKGGEQAWWDLIYRLDFEKNDLIKIGKFIRKNRNVDNLSGVILNSLVHLDLSDNGKLLSKILIERIKKLLSNIGKNVPDLVKEIYRICGLINRQETKKDKVIMMNLSRFYDLAKSYSGLYEPDLGSFIHYLEIIESLGIEINALDSEEKGVRLMTLHATKGLEYNTVIVTNLSQKRFPMERINKNPLIPIELTPEFDSKGNGKLDLEYYLNENEMKNQLYEERRLCYVAFTRAKSKLILTYAKKYGEKYFYPSKFLDEIEFKNNIDVSFIVDEEEKYEEPKLELKPSVKFNSLLKSDKFEDMIVDVINKKDVRPTVNIDKLIFSPSSLQTFLDCEKKYEYKYVYNMPEEKTIHWEAMMIGSFVHTVLEQGVKRKFKSLKEFFDLAKMMGMESNWEEIDMSEVLNLIRIFFSRNIMKYDNNSKTEIKLNCVLRGVRFTGFADRIDFKKDGLEIIDYKTGKGNVSPSARNWQLGYYALAASGLGKVKKLTLDMLRQEKPLEFEIDDRGNAKSLISSRMEGFNIYSVENELIETAQSVLKAYKKGFRECGLQKGCEFCNEWIY